MLRTNLSTRPFYNERAVRLGLAAAVVSVSALSAFNALQVFTLNARNSEMIGRAEQAEAQTAEYRDRARKIMQSMNRDEVTAVQEAAREANLLIDRRAFSWTDLFNRFENTLPSDVRISSVEPQIDREGRMLVAVSVISRRVEDLHAFMDQLEAAGGLRDVISRQDVILDDGSQQSVIQGYYNPGAVAPAATTPPSASDPSGPVNDSPTAPNASPAAGAPGAGPSRGGVATPREAR